MRRDKGDGLEQTTERPAFVPEDQSNLCPHSKSGHLILRAHATPLANLAQVRLVLVLVSVGEANVNGA